MKLKKFAHLLVLALLVAVVTGCPKRPEDLSKIHGYPPGVTGPPENGLTNLPPESVTPGIPAVSPDKFKDYVAHPEVFKSDTVHFAFDSSSVRKDEKPKVADVASYLKGHAGDAVRVEGHCDERGTAEYNRSLGERRALALREELVKEGVDAGLVETITYGFDRPVDPEHTETAWTRNRRGEFILLTPPPKGASATNTTDSPK